MTNLKILGPIFVAALLTFIGCSKEDALNLDGNDYETGDFNTACEVAMAYDIVQSTWAEPRNSVDSENLERPDQFVGLPQVVACHVESCFDGATWNTRMEGIPSNSVIDYPKNTIGSPATPTFSRAEIINNSATFYDEDNQLISNASLGLALPSNIEVIENLGEAQPMSEETLNIFIDAMVNEGYDISSEHSNHPNWLTLRHTLPDGTKAEAILDMNKYVIISQQNFDASDNLRSRRFYKFSGSPGNLVLEKIFFEAPYKSPFSGVEMMIKQYSTITNYSLTY